MNHHYVNLAVVLAAIATPAMAQHQHSGATPAKPTAVTKPPTNYVVKSPSALSPLQRYQRFSADEPLTDWLAANHMVRDIGGWRVYAKEAAQANRTVPLSAATNAEGKK